MPNACGPTVPRFSGNLEIVKGVRGYIKRGRKPFLERTSYLVFAVGVRGFEPPTTTTPLWCATGLRYTPSLERNKYSRNVGGSSSFLSALTKSSSSQVPNNASPEELFNNSILCKHSSCQSFSATI